MEEQTNPESLLIADWDGAIYRIARALLMETFSAATEADVLTLAGWDGTIYRVPRALLMLHRATGEPVPPPDAAVPGSARNGWRRRSGCAALVRRLRTQRPISAQAAFAQCVAHATGAGAGGSLA